jgi:hypothetical protein
MIEFFPALHGMKDIVTSIFHHIIHYFKQIAIPIKTNEQKLVGIPRKQTIKHDRCQGAMNIRLSDAVP